MGHDINFNELTTPVESMTPEEMHECIDNLREIISEDKLQWDKLARILQADGDNVDAVFAAARLLASHSAYASAVAALEQGARELPAVAGLHRHVDAAIAYEMERFNRQRSEVANMSVEEFLRFKIDAKPASQSKPERRGLRALTRDIFCAIVMRNKT